MLRQLWLVKDCIFCSLLSKHSVGPEVCEATENLVNELLTLWQHPCPCAVHCAVLRNKTSAAMQSNLDGLIRRGDMPSSIAVVVPKQVLGAVRVGSQEDNLLECLRLQREAGLPRAAVPIFEQHNACRLAIRLFRG